MRYSVIYAYRLSGGGVMDYEVLDIEDENETIEYRDQFEHKSFEYRLKEYNGKISVCDFDWGDSQGKEMI